MTAVSAVVYGVPRLLLLQFCVFGGVVSYKDDYGNDYNNHGDDDNNHNDNNHDNSNPGDDGNYGGPMDAPTDAPIMEAPTSRRLLRLLP